MRHVIHETMPDNKYEVAILIKEEHLRKKDLDKNYIEFLNQKGIKSDQCISFSLTYNESDKCPVKLIKEYLATLLKALKTLEVKYLYVADSAYFKVLTKKKKAEPYHGSSLPCAIEGYEDMRVILGVSYPSLFYNPKNKEKLELSLTTLVNVINKTHKELGSGIIHSEKYPASLIEIKAALHGLHKYNLLSCDIETFSLRVDKAGLGTIGFAWDKHNGIAFCVDIYSKIGKYVREALREFFLKYQGKLMWHGSTFDVKILIHELFMEDLDDQKGLLEGIHCLAECLDDTKLITYLATNSAVGNKLGLKENSHEFTGNYAQEDIKDITKIPRQELLRYNLTDCLATWFTREKYYDQMVADGQEPVYYNLFLPAVPDIIQMELSGMPLDMDKVREAEKELAAILKGYTDSIANSPTMQVYMPIVRKKAQEAHNAKLKKKVCPLSDWDDLEFNPNSPKQIQELLYDYLEFPILDTTDTGLPGTGADTLKKLKHKTKDKELLQLLDDLIGVSEVSIILSTFIKSFIKNSIQHPDGVWYLHGNFNLGGTVSGRLSSSGPNMQNIPSTGSKYAKLIKMCFVAPPTWIFGGADFDSLEDRISALTTKDPNKLKVYTDGFDGHCLRAYAYFADEMPDIDGSSVESINSIAKKYKPLRQRSKTPTFALTYQGTYHTLMANEGMSKEEAQAIEKNYHDLYAVSDKWVADKLEEASKTGYVVGAFGLRLRTPVIKQVYLNKKCTPYAAASEGRTAGNMLGQSYGLLNTRACTEFMQRVRNSEYRLDIKPIAQIHDAIYLLWRDTYGCTKWVNENLIDCMRWNELPDIQHPEVKLGASLEIFHPNWANGIDIPNNASKKDLRDIFATL